MKILLRSGIVLILSVFLLFACGEVDDKQLVVTAKKYIENNQLREANLELKNALQANPKNAEARYLLGEINITIGDMASAAKEFRKAQEAGWDEAQSQIGLMRALIYSRDFKKVLDDIQIKESFSSNARADLFGLKAFAQAASGFTELVKESIKQGVALDKDAFQVLKTSIQLDITSGKYNAAAMQIKHALSLYKNNAELLLLSAYLAMQNKDSVAAAEQFQKVISLDPENFVTFNGRKARLALARLEMLNKKMEHAKSLLAPLLKQSADDPEINYIGGLLSFEQADFDLAEERLLKVLKVAPEHVKTQLLIGSVNFAQKDYEQAAYYISKYLQLEPENIGARKLLGKTYIFLGQHEEAKATLQYGLQESDDAELLALIGLSQLQGGDIASGITDLEKAMLAAPDGHALRSELAKAYLSAGKTENAINQLNKLIAGGGNRNQAEVLMVSAYLRAKQYDQAINVVLGILERSPQDATTLSLVANVFATSGDRLEARKYFNQALKIEPDNIQATMLLARLEELDGRSAEAEVLYKKLVATNTEDIASLMALAHLAEAQGQTEKMLMWLEKARDRAPQNIKPVKVLAEYYLREKQLGKAALLVNEAIKIAPRDYTLLVIQARLQIAEGQYNKALSSLNELIIRLPDSVYIRTMLAEVYLNLQQRADAHSQLEIVLEKQPDYSPALVLMASLELRSANYEQSLKYAERIQKAGPDLYIGYELAGDALQANKNYTDAKISYEKAWERKQLVELVIKLSEVSARLGNFEQAVSPLLAWLDEHPSDTRVLQLLGTTYQKMKNDDKAIETFEKVLALQPENVVALNNLAWLYSLAKNPKALPLAEKAYKLSANDSGVQDTYGWLLVENGQVEKGKRILERVVKALPEVLEVQYHYAVALMKSGEKVKAQEILINLLEQGKLFEGRDEAQALLN
ncbi:MAG: PEP-CTERM system TPR-repeat protein PrsT [Gammaproteobacteria bacterium]|nr:PEP-CTERM system TPR-repeat protein PrsT [Gammaproteobacteria bacterium]